MPSIRHATTSFPVPGAPRHACPVNHGCAACDKARVLHVVTRANEHLTAIRDQLSGLSDLAVLDAALPDWTRVAAYNDLPVSALYRHRTAKDAWLLVRGWGTLFYTRQFVPSTQFRIIPATDDHSDSVDVFVGTAATMLELRKHPNILHWDYWWHWLTGSLSGEQAAAEHLLISLNLPALDADGRRVPVRPSA